MQEAATRAVRKGLRGLDRKARGFVPSDVSILKDGAFPTRIHLDDWDWPVHVDDVVRGVVLDSDRAFAVVQIGDYRARVGPEDVAWTKRPVSEALPRGTVAPFLIVSLSEEGGRKEARVTLEQEPKVEGALLALDPRSGAVRAMVGGYDFEKSKFNRATQAFRQVGSAFKPILYSAALERAGFTPATIIVDAPISFPSEPGKVWTPHNYDYKFLGPIPLRYAIEQSRNIPAIKTLQTVGIETGIEYARKLGLTGELPPYLPIAIGAGEATLQEMTAAFATFANQGLRMKPMYVTRITDRDGNVIEEARPQGKDAIRADTAYIMTSLLRGVAERGTAARARALKRPIGGKTGTTDDWTDGWFIGFEPSLAAGVWVGFDEKKESLGRGRDGAHTALPIWMEFWAEAMKDKPIEEYSIPGNIVFVPVDGYGQPGPAGMPGVRMEAFVAGTEPRASLSTGSSEP
jgi:penicillin-binding protein 1A